jgi:hypothetical protein
VGHKSFAQLYSLTSHSQGCLLTLYILVECLRNERLKDPWTSLEYPGRSTLLYAIKFTLSLAIYPWRRRAVGKNASNRLPGEGQDEERLVDGPVSSGRDSPNETSWQSSQPPLRAWTSRSMLFMSAVAALYVLRDYTVSKDVILHMMCLLTLY